MLVGDVRSRAPEAHEGRKRSANRPVGRLPERLMVLGKGCQGISVIQRPPPPMGDNRPRLACPDRTRRKGRRPRCIGLLALVAQLTRGGAAHSWWRRPVSPRWATHGSSPRGRFGGPPPQSSCPLRSSLRGQSRRAWASHFPQHHVHPVRSNLAFATSISNHLLALISRFSPVSSAMTEKHDREILVLG